MSASLLEEHTDEKPSYSVETVKENGMRASITHLGEEAGIHPKRTVLPVMRKNECICGRTEVAFCSEVGNEVLAASEPKDGVP